MIAAACNFASPVMTWVGVLGACIVAANVAMIVRRGRRP